MSKCWRIRSNFPRQLLCLCRWLYQHLVDRVVLRERMLEPVSCCIRDQYYAGVLV